MIRKFPKRDLLQGPPLGQQQFDFLHATGTRIKSKLPFDGPAPQHYGSLAAPSGLP